MFSQISPAAQSLAALHHFTAAAASLGLESAVYVAKMRRQWGDCPPTSMKVIEFHGDGDKAFGGQADDRVLGVDGRIGVGTVKTPAIFPTIEAAHQAAATIPNRRSGSTLGVLPVWS